MSELIRYAQRDGVATVTLDRPQKLHALTLPMLDELERRFSALDVDPACRVVMLAASGDKAFCAGADIEAWSALGALGMWRQWIRHGHRVFDLLAALRQPTIALVQGIAFGGGLELALACDLRIAAMSAQFCLPETKLGTIPGWAGGQRLSKLVGSARAKQMVFTGEPIDAQKALAWGLVNEALPSQQLAERAQAIAQQIAGNAPIAVQTAKQVMDGGEGLGTTAVLNALASAVTNATEDAGEGLRAFRDRRPGKFSGA